MTAPAPVRVLIVDDSAVIRRSLRQGLHGREGIEVIGSVSSAFEAHEAIFRLRPDVLTLDVEMPQMDGLTFLEKLMRHHPMPVVVHSSMTPKNSPQAILALSLGAVDVVPKAEDRAGAETAMTRLAKSVRAAARSRPRMSQPTAPNSSPDVRVVSSKSTPIRAIGIAASTGGTQALEGILRRIPGDFPCILIVQHLPESFVASFATRLDGLSAARVQVARGNEALRAGLVLIAPGDRHLSVAGAEPRTRLTDGPQVNFHRPSADVLFRGMARCLGAKAVGVVLTGMGRDGATGLGDMRAAGAHTIAESESSCVVYGMPRAAIESGAVEEIVELDRVPNRLARAVCGAAVPAP